MPDKYPIEILPKSRYRHFMRTCMLLSKYPDLTIARRVDGEDGDIYADSNDGGKKEIRTNKIGNLYGWSVNLLGGLFDENIHSAYNPDGERVEVGWNGTDEIPTPVLGVDYDFLAGPFIVIYLKVCDMHLAPIPYFKSLTLKEYPEIKAKAERIAQESKLRIQQAVVGEFQPKPNPGANFTGRTMINHYPTDLNYWHFQVDFYKGTDIRPLRDKDRPKGEVDKIKRHVRRLINENYSLEPPKPYHINRKFYIRNVSCIESKIDCIKDKIQ